MAGSRVPDDLVVQSHRGPYRVQFERGAFQGLRDSDPGTTFAVVDRRVADLYESQLGDVLQRSSTLFVEATEANKSLESLPDYVEHLVQQGIRKPHVLVAIGGGIVQDIACFLAATLLRGLRWHFFPTTLLAQADSCIGSKSSINVRSTKNAVGTFTPPEQVVIDVTVLETLDAAEIRSGVGEMLKVHAIAGPDTFDEIAADYKRLLTDRALLEDYIVGSLKLKRVLIEEDEFDEGPRRIMNYGHSFGHAIESATGYAIPHG
ncbi:MAG: iron-containing alcohol dehydrogenase, partial [Actinobacteria bacterium]|nr:iron-containing alcohol dehydrogenase [Actinomycetota bacterium]